MKSTILNFIIPALILGVVANQFYQVQTHHLTHWKGGGFGMYAAITWNYREVWFFGLPNHINPFEGFEREVAHTRQYPSDQTILYLGNKVKEKYNVTELRVEVWEPRLGEEGKLTKAFINGVDVK